MSRLDGARSTISMWHQGDYSTHTQGAKDAIDNARDIACGAITAMDLEARASRFESPTTAPPMAAPRWICTARPSRRCARAHPSRRVHHLHRSPAQRLFRTVHHRERRTPRRHELPRRARRHLRLRRGDELLRADLPARDHRLRVLRDRDALAERAALPRQRPHPHGRGARGGTGGVARSRAGRLAGHPPRPRLGIEARRTAADGKPRARGKTADTWAIPAAPTCSTS